MMGEMSVRRVALMVIADYLRAAFTEPTGDLGPVELAKRAANRIRDYRRVIDDLLRDKEMLERRLGACGIDRDLIMEPDPVYLANGGYTTELHDAKDNAIEENGQRYYYRGVAVMLERVEAKIM